MDSRPKWNETSRDRACHEIYVFPHMAWCYGHQAMRRSRVAIMAKLVILTRDRIFGHQGRTGPFWKLVILNSLYSKECEEQCESGEL